MKNPYPEEDLGESDDGSMVSNIEQLRAALIGKRIIKVEQNADLPDTLPSWERRDKGFALSLNNGKRVFLVDTDDCCAYTNLDGVLQKLDKIDHVITGVGTTDSFMKWHIYADLGDLLELDVGWSPGNPFYYGYGFNILVVDDDSIAPVTDEEVRAALLSITEGLT